MISTEEAKRRHTILVSTLDENEMVVRMIEAATGGTRPAPDPVAALAITDPDIVGCMQRAARAAIDYWRERINAGQAPS